MKGIEIKNPLVAPVIDNGLKTQFVAIHSANYNGKSLLSKVLAREIMPQLVKNEPNKRVVYVEQECGMVQVARHVIADPRVVPSFTYSTPPYPKAHEAEGFIEYLGWLANDLGGEVSFLVIDCPELTDRMCPPGLGFIHSPLYHAIQELFLHKDINVMMTFGRRDPRMVHMTPQLQNQPYFGEPKTEEFVYDFIDHIGQRYRMDEFYFPIGIGRLAEPLNDELDTVIVSPEEKHFVKMRDLAEYVQPLTTLAIPSGGSKGDEICTD